MNGKTLTAEQCSKLSLYILMTTKTREGEAEAWEKLAEEKKEDGSPKYIHAADNAQFWRELDADLRKILRDLEGCEHVVTEPWAKDIISYRCFAPGRCKGRVVGVKRFDPYIPAWCPKLERSRENG